MRIPVFSGSDNTESFAIKLGGVDYSFAGVTSVAVFACNQITRRAGEAEKTVNSDTDAVNYTPGNNVLDIRFGYLDLSPGLYDCKVKVYTESKLLGEVIIGPGLPSNIILDVKC